MSWPDVRNACGYQARWVVPRETVNEPCPSLQYRGAGFFLCDVTVDDDR